PDGESPSSSPVSRRPKRVRSASRTSRSRPPVGSISSTGPCSLRVASSPSEVRIKALPKVSKASRRTPPRPPCAAAFVGVVRLRPRLLGQLTEPVPQERQRRIRRHPHQLRLHRLGLHHRWRQSAVRSVGLR